MRKIGRILAVSGIVVAVLALLAGGAFLYMTRRPFPQVSGTLRASGLTGQVRVVRDKWGIPQIHAENLHDLYFAQGFVTSQDRLWQMEFWRRIGAGRLSEILGKSTLGTDLFIRAVGWRRSAEVDFKLMDPRSRETLQFYADGVNAFVDSHRDRLPLEFTILGLTGAKFSPEPWTPVDTITWGKVMAWDLGGNWSDELLRSRILARSGTDAGTRIIAALWSAYSSDHPVIVPTGSARLGYGAMDFTEAADLRALLQTGKDGIGSNNWVVAGERTSTGKPLLANDMHLGIQMPSIWYEVGLHCTGAGADPSFDVAGFAFPGVPGVVVGHNGKIAWGVTNLGPDVQDLFIERRNPANPDQFEYRGAWEDAEVLQESVRVSGKLMPEDFTPTANMRMSYDAAAKSTTIVFTVRVTRHGPVLNDVIGSLRDSPDAVTMKWTALQPGTSVVPAVLAVDRAQNWDEFRDALRLWDTAAQNFVYADVDGNIGYQATGLVPIRAKGEGDLPVPGWSGDYEWKGYIPFDRMPSRFNPREGFIVTANNAVVDGGYPYLIARDWDSGYRARRITDLIRAKEKLSVDDFRAIQGDNYDLFADTLMPFLAALKAATPVQEDALRALAGWDRVARRESPGASLFGALVFRVVADVFSDELGPQLAQEYVGAGSTSRAAIAELLDRPGDPAWDDIGTADRVEGRDAILQRAFEEACADLEARLGSRVSGWNWGRLHTTTFRNGSLGQSGIPIIEAIFNRGPVVTDGTGVAVNATSFSVAPDKRYTVSWGPSERYIADLADWSRSLAVHSTGQSGLPFNRHYDDMIELWRNIGYHPMLWPQPGAQKSGEGALTLTP